jgi:hypothetical protein
MRVAWGVLCVVAPERVVGVFADARPDRPSVTVTRILGGRHVAQGVLSGLVPSRFVLGVGGAIDVAHAASMAALGALDRDRRRLAWIDAAIAGTWGAASLGDRPRR